MYSSIMFSTAFHVISRKMDYFSDSIGPLFFFTISFSMSNVCMCHDIFEWKYFLLLSRGCPPLLSFVSYNQGWASVLFKRMQHSRVLLCSFQKNETFSAFFYVFYKRTRRSLLSFTFFIKEHSVLLCTL